MFVVGTSLSAVLLIAILITIHEFGHFIAAKALGVRVHVFSVGIGGRAFGVQWGDTDYRVSWFPFGGYVRMAGADPFMDGGGDEGDDLRAPGSFMARPAWQRLVIIAAGPAMNLVLPFVVFTVLMIAGEPQPRADIRGVAPASAAAEAGLLPGDRLITVDGTPVSTWVDVADAIAASSGDDIAVEVVRADARISAALATAGIDFGEVRGPVELGLRNQAPDATVVVDDPRSAVARAGMRTGDRVVAVNGAAIRDWTDVRAALSDVATATLRWVPFDPANPDAALPEREARVVADAEHSGRPEAADDDLWQRWGLATAVTAVGRLEKESAAALAGVTVGDRVLAIDDTPVRSWEDIVRGVSATVTGGEGRDMKVREIRLDLRRNGEVVRLRFTPKVVNDSDELGRSRWRALIGVGPIGDYVSAPEIPRPYPPIEAFLRASDRTLLVGSFMVEQLGMLITLRASIEDNLGGPVEMFRQTQKAAEGGVFSWAQTLGLLSISLGIINLVPVPVLDGGQLLMYGAEWIRGRPLPLIFRERAQQAGVIFLVLLMLFVFFNDIKRAIGS